MNGQRVLHSLVGKTVNYAHYGIRNGYGYLSITFGDGTVVEAGETSQTGELKLKLGSIAFWPQSEDYEDGE
jgi:hypothetical protein